MVRGRLILPTLLLAALAGCTSPERTVAAKENLPAIMAQADAGPQLVARLQKAESEVAKPAPSARSVLDLVSYETPPSDSLVAARIRATVNGVAILDSELREAVYPVLMATQGMPEPERSARRKEAFDKELQQIIEREVILQDMFARLKDKQLVLDKLKEAAGKEFEKRMRELRKRAKIKSDEEFKAVLRSQSVSLAGVRRQVERNFMAMEYMRNLLAPAIDRVGLQQVLEYYQKHPEEFQVPDSVVWQDLFIDAGRFPDRESARKLAQNIIVEARGGQDFQRLVTQYDNGDSSYRNGEGYGRRRGEIKPPQAEPVLFGMKDGDLAVVELTSGYHVVRLVKREHAGTKPFDDKTQAAIRNKLQNQAWEREYKRVIAQMKQGAAIEVSTATP
jgi:peptidyl-prolyl cis-trans isomerase SurA